MVCEERAAARTLGGWLLASVVAALWLGCAEDSSDTRRDAPSAPRPSILLLTVEALRVDHLPFYGYERDTAPFLNRLREQGTLFQRACSTSSWTVPALATLVTGVSPRTHGVVHGTRLHGELVGQEILPHSLTTLGEVLQQAGYRTYAVVANGHAGAEFGFERGFERYACPGFRTPAGKVNQSVFQWQEEIESSAEPVFLWVHYFDPHHPYHQRAPWYGVYERGSAGGGEPWDLEQLMQAAAARDPRQLRRIISSYDSEINYWDDFVRRLYDRMPYLRDWVMVLSADHGEEFLDHEALTHSWNLYNETVRVPLLIYRPWDRSPATREEPVSWLDLPATLVSIAGGAVPSHWQGVSLVDGDGTVSRDLDEERRLLLFLDRWGTNTVSLIGPRWKLIVDAKKGGLQVHDLHENPWQRTNLAPLWKRIVDAKKGGLELYDLHEDPEERTNLAPLRRHQVDELNRTLQETLARVPTPSSPPEYVEIDPELEQQLRSLGYVP